MSISDLAPRGNSWRVRWRVDGRQHERSFSSKAVADRFRRSLFDAVDSGDRLDRVTGEPSEWGPAAGVPTIAVWARTWFERRWEQLAPKTRGSNAEVAISVVVATTTVPPPDGADLRSRIRDTVCRRPGTPEPEPATPAELRAQVHLERWSPPLDEFDHDAAAALWSALGRRLDGTRAAATTSTRARTLATKMFDDAVRAGHIKVNPLRQIDRPRRRSAHAVDPSLLPTPSDARRLIDSVASRSEVGARAFAYLTTILEAGCRPAEAHGLRAGDIDRSMSQTGGAVITFRRGRTQSTSAFTDDGTMWDERDVLKWRAEGETRAVTAPPSLVEAIDAHVRAYPTAPNGFLFTTASGVPISTDLSRTWRAAVEEMWPAPHPFCGLRPYDLRHIHATALIAAGANPARIARRLGHSLAVLYSTYAGVFASLEESDEELIAAALAC